MSDDLPNSEVVDQFHDDLLVERLTDCDSTGFLNNLEKGVSFDEVPKTASRGFFYSLVRSLMEIFHRKGGIPCRHRKSTG